MKAFARPFLLWLAVFLAPQLAFAQLNREEPEAMQNIGIDEHLGDYIPLDAQFTNSDGSVVSIADLIEEGKPFILNPVYYHCPMLCSLVLEGVERVVHELQWKPGKEYTIITLSIDPEEDYQIAAQSKEDILSKMDNSSSISKGWHFLTGNKTEIDRVVEAVGFQYKLIEDTGEYAHSAAIMFISPDGKITRYLYGIAYDEFSVRNALYEAADGKIGNTMNRILLYCYQYDPESGSYTPIAFNIMKVGGLATLLFLGILFVPLWMRERRKKQP